MIDTMSIKALKAIQREHELGHDHLVDVGHKGFTVAHTDAERARGTDLEQCSLHLWLTALDGPPVEPGVYIARTHEPDGYSESYRSDPWDFEPIAALVEEEQNR